jgi:hypothetical protein
VTLIVSGRQAAWQGTNQSQRALKLQVSFGVTVKKVVRHQKPQMSRMIQLTFRSAVVILLRAGSISWGALLISGENVGCVPHFEVLPWNS